MDNSKHLTIVQGRDEFDFINESVGDETSRIVPLAGVVFDSEAELVKAFREVVCVVLLPTQACIVVENGFASSILSKTHAKLWYSGTYLAVTHNRKTRYVAALPLYLNHPDCLRFTGITNDPRVPYRSGELYGSWRGFRRLPKKGDWSKIKKHLLENVCAGNIQHFEWLMCWMAQILQEPHNKLGTAVILRGPKGCGKSTIAVFLRQIIGPRHSRKVSQQSHVVGKFNDHLRDAVFLQVEEGVWGGNKQADGVLKDLITGDTIMIEAKGVAVIEVMSLTRLMITSNEDWIVPATPGERRYFVLDCLDPFPGLAEVDPKRLAYFKELYDQAENGGLEAMMWELMYETDITAVNLRKPPVTEALKEQMAQTFTEEEEWLLSALILGGFTDRDGNRLGEEWPLDKPLQIKTEDLVKSYRDHIRTYSGSAPGTSKVLAFLNKMGPISRKRLTVGRERPWGCTLAPRKVWQDQFTRDYHYKFDNEV